MAVAENEKKKKITDEEEPVQSIASDSGAEEGGDNAGWLMTYGDMMTLLLCFFVLMFAMSETKQDDFFQLIQSLKVALGKQEVPEAGTREGLEMIDITAEKQTVAVDELGNLVTKELNKIDSEIKEFIVANKLAGKVKADIDGRGAVITISDVVIFPPAESRFSNAGKEILAGIVEILKQFNYHIRVEGHTDSVPISSERFSSNWELSANRACEIVRYFISEGVLPEMLSAEGFAEYRPIADNSTVEGRATNRRVEIVYERSQIEREILNSADEVILPADKLPTEESSIDTVMIGGKKKK